MPFARRRKQINDYVLEGKIGSGASSAVYLGVKATTGEKYALKRLRLADLARTGDSLAGLEREVRLMRRLRHPNILSLIEVLRVPSANDVYLVLEYADGGSLGSLIAQSHLLPLPSVLSIVKQIAQALHSVHGAGFVHQDIKPSNILLTASGRAVLSDFGIGHSFTSAAMVVGSPAYQAPEALDDAADALDGDPAKEDVWALGITLYQTLFLRLPFVGANLFEIVNAVRETPLAIPEGTDPLVADLLRGMINVNPAERFTIEEVLDHPLIREGAERAPGLPEAQAPPARSGAEPVLLQAEVCPEGTSFAEIAVAIKRRSSVQECGFLPSRQSTDAIPRASPKHKAANRASEGDLQLKRWNT